MADFTKILEEKNSYLSSVFQQKFLWLKDSSLFIFKGLEKSRKEKSLGIVFVLHFYFILEVFPSIFLCDFDFQTLYFLTLEQSIYHIY